MIAIALLLAQSAGDPATLARGEKIFAQSCSVGYCHGAAGAAGRGPRLRGRNFSKDYLYNVTKDGIPNSAMPAWKGRLKDEDIRAVVDYVAGLSSATDAAPPANPMPPGIGPASLASFNGPPQAARGHALFFDSTRENCGACHSIGGRGIAIGPDLKSLPELVTVARSTHSRHVLAARLKSGEEFPALLAEQNGRQIHLYDVTTAPPVLRTFARDDVVSLKENPSWSHGDFVKDYSEAELEDIGVYVRWATEGK
jgi:mono/diheme cytochrome c family protein